MSSIHSKKAKGRRLQQKVRDLLLEKTENIGLVPGDIESTPMSSAGRDIKLSPAAEKVIPFDIECKNQERLQIWSAIEQSHLNTKKDRIPLLVFSRNRDDIYAAIKFEDLLKLLFEK